MNNIFIFKNKYISNKKLDGLWTKTVLNLNKNGYNQLLNIYQFFKDKCITGKHFLYYKVDTKEFVVDFDGKDKLQKHNLYIYVNEISFDWSSIYFTDLALISYLSYLENKTLLGLYNYFHSIAYLLNCLEDFSKN